jgi:hypothetical protein
MELLAPSPAVILGAVGWTVPAILQATRTVRRRHLRLAHGDRAREFAFVAYPGHPAFTPAGATATPMAPPRSIALCKKPDTRTSSINALTRH